MVEVWPEHYQAFDIFHSLQTQWRMGFNGPTGLDYGVLYQKLDRLQLPMDEADWLERDVQVMERAALSAINDRANERAKDRK